ncbi:MAG TPA: hypothetical protein VFB90_09040 [Dehalococcoidia bacterium]|nr:hypothetical protein [Dehalococcoidia bacterium]
MLAIAAALTACGSSGSKPPSPTATATARPSATATPTGTATGGSPQATPFQGSRGPFSGPGTVTAPPALLSDVRAARQAGFDRVVFEFSNGLPAYRVEYVQPPIILDPSGQTVQVKGAAFLKVTFMGGAAHNDAGNPTFGSTDLMPNLQSVLEVRQTGDFEAVLTWVIGLTKAADLTVTTLTGPSRLVIDIAQP